MRPAQAGRDSSSVVAGYRFSAVQQSNPEAPVRLRVRHAGQPRRQSHRGVYVTADRPEVGPGQPIEQARPRTGSHEILKRILDAICRALARTSGLRFGADPLAPPAKARCGGRPARDSRGRQRSDIWALTGAHCSYCGEPGPLIGAFWEVVPCLGGWWSCQGTSRRRTPRRLSVHRFLKQCREVSHRFARLTNRSQRKAGAQDLTAAVCPFLGHRRARSQVPYRSLN